MSLGCCFFFFLLVLLQANGKTLLWLDTNDCPSLAHLPQTLPDLFLVADAHHPCLLDRPTLPWIPVWEGGGDYHSLRAQLATWTRSVQSQRQAAAYLDMAILRNASALSSLVAYAETTVLRLQWTNEDRWVRQPINQTDDQWLQWLLPRAEQVDWVLSVSQFRQHWWPTYERELFPLSRRPMANFHRASKWRLLTVWFVDEATTFMGSGANDCAVPVGGEDGLLYHLSREQPLRTERLTSSSNALGVVWQWTGWIDIAFADGLGVYLWSPQEPEVTYRVMVAPSLQQRRLNLVSLQSRRVSVWDV